MNKTLVSFFQPSYFLIKRELNKKYGQSLFGILWLLIKPIAVVLSFSFLMGDIANLNKDYENYVLLVISGVLPWELFSGIIINCSSIVISNKSIIPKIPVNKHIFLFVALSISMIEYAVLLTLGLIVIISLEGLDFIRDIHLFLIASSLIISVILGSAIGFSVSAYSVWYRDIRSITTYLLQFLMILSPVGFSSAKFGDSLFVLQLANPMLVSIDLFRTGINIENVNLSDFLLTNSLVTCTILLLISLVVYNRLQSFFSDII